MLSYGIKFAKITFAQHITNQCLLHYTYGSITNNVWILLCVQINTHKSTVLMVMHWIWSLKCTRFTLNCMWLMVHKVYYLCGILMYFQNSDFGHFYYAYAYLVLIQFVSLSLMRVLKMNRVSITLKGH